MLYDSGHNKVPAQLLAGISKVHYGRSHQYRPEHNGQFTGIHLVDLTSLVHPVEVCYEEAKGAQVGMWHGTEDRMDLYLVQIYNIRVKQYRRVKFGMKCSFFQK